MIKSLLASIHEVGRTIKCLCYDCRWRECDGFFHCGTALSPNVAWPSSDLRFAGSGNTNLCFLASLLDVAFALGNCRGGDAICRPGAEIMALINCGPSANDKLYVLVLIPSIALSHPHLRPALGRTSPASFVPLQRCPAAKEKQPGAM